MFVWILLNLALLLAESTTHAFQSTSKPLSSPSIPLFSTYLDNLNGMTTHTSSASPPAAPFVTKHVLGLAHADVIANQVIAVCQRNAFNPVTVVVLDESGSTLVHKRMDGCSPRGIPDFAHAKAFSCIVNGYPSRNFRDRYTGSGDLAKFGQLVGMCSISQGTMAPFPGGIVLQYNGSTIGAVGVSGAAGDEDEYCAITAVAEVQLGLQTIPAQHSCSTVRDA